MRLSPELQWSGRPGFFRLYLFAGALVLTLASILYVQSLVRRLQEEPRTVSALLARLCASASIPMAESTTPGGEVVFQEIIKSINFPVIFTDLEGRPRAWRRVGIDAGSISAEDLASTDPSLVQGGPIRKLIDLAAELDRRHPPIPLKVPSGGDSVLVGYVHYGNTKIIDELRWMPVVQVLIVGLFILVGWLGFRGIRANEERAIWVGMARETAHQLGTPLSALLGWLEVLRSGADTGIPRDPERGVETSPPPRQDVLDAIGTDLGRLERVASRFSRIGARPRLERLDICQPLEETISYVRRRLPSLGKNVEIHLECRERLVIRGDRELLQWALENLLRNALDALDKQPALITVKAAVQARGRGVEILVTDNGRGIPPRLQKLIFRSGFTTKSVGWGLGLSLTRRIVEDYHRGRLALKSSKIGAGSTFQILLPPAPAEFPASGGDS
jgi:hypothetical protein